MYRSPPLRQERKIVEDTTDHDAHAKDHEAQDMGSFGLVEFGGRKHFIEEVLKK